MSKEKWIKDILQSGKDLSPVPVNPFLATRVEARISALGEKGSQPVLSTSWVLASALAMTVLLVLNVLIWSTATPSPKKTAGIQQVMQEYGWGNNDIYTMNF
jgi:hypothetical protein